MAILYGLARPEGRGEPVPTDDFRRADQVLRSYTGIFGDDWSGEGWPQLTVFLAARVRYHR
jgi:hypothetical protein